MQSKFNARVGKIYAPASQDIRVTTVMFKSQDIEKWRTAINSARSETLPRRKQLIELFMDIILDGHLRSVMDKRVNALANKKIVFEQKGKEGEVNESIRDNLLNTPWFYQTTKYKGESKPWGYSLVELIPKAGIIDDVKLIKRKVVRPEHMFMQWTDTDYSSGIHFEEDPYYKNNMFYFGQRDFGLLESAAQYVIYKRGGFGDWAQYAELFGMPFITGTYPLYDEKAKKMLDDAFKNLGGNSRMTHPDGTTVDVKDNSGTGKSEVFEKLIKMCNDEMSKIFLGQTMTTEDGSSHSQSKVHKEVEDEILLADMIEYEYDLNWMMVDKFRALGFDIPEGQFRFDTTKQLPKEKLIDVAIKVSQNVPIADEWWYKTFNIEKPSEAELKKKKEELDEKQKKEKEEEEAAKAKEKKDPQPPGK